MTELHIKKRVFQYGFALLLTRCLAFLFTLFIIRSLPLEEIGAYFYLIGISFVLEIVITWGTPVSIQTQSEQIKNSNSSVSSAILGIIASLLVVLLFFLSEITNLINLRLGLIPILFILSTMLANCVSSIAIAYHRSLLESKSDIVILLTKEAVKCGVLFFFNLTFQLTLTHILILLISINSITFTYLLIHLLRKSSLVDLRLKTDLNFLIKQGTALMVSFIIYAFPFIFVRVFSFLHLGSRDAGLLNICLLTNAVFQLYAGSWAMAIKPLLGRLNNQGRIMSLKKTWEEANWIYLGGCALIFTGCLLFSNPILRLFKIDPTSSLVHSLYVIVLLYNLIFSIGSLNNSFLQMQKLTRQELKAMSPALILYPLIIFFCIGRDAISVAWALILFELFKVVAQEYVLYKKSVLHEPKKLFPKLVVILAGAAIAILYF